MPRRSPRSACTSIAACVAIALTGRAASADAIWDERHRRFDQSDWAIVGGLVVGIGTTYLAVPEPKPKWRGGVYFDGYLADTVRAKTVDGRRVAARISDVLLFTNAAWPFVDAGVAAWAVHGDQDAASQIALISMESYLLMAFVKISTERAIARERPFVAGCTDATVPGFPTCDGGGNYRSFFSGHTSTAFTGAGLVCAHHAAMPLYGGIWDPLACGIALATASTTGLMRMIADEHYATDVVTGAILGIAVGYLLPRLAHYRARSDVGAVSQASAPVISFGGRF